MARAPDLRDIPFYCAGVDADGPMHVGCGQFCLCRDIPQGRHFIIAGIPIPTALVDLQRVETVVADYAMPRWADAGEQCGVAWVGDRWQDAAHALGIAAVRDEAFKVRDIDPAFFRLDNVIGL